ncbi:hypothetical protein, partial [Deinococcus sp.]|uniref:tetratricopeptide repeat protein n=1 Tax=Deinococcus sp. TaxID=47478 RepID=UPI0025C03CB2
AILRELAQETGRPLDTPVIARPAPLPDELELLGRTKKRVYKQFTAALRAGRHPRLAVSGKAGVGKTVLLSYLATSLQAAGQTVCWLNLVGDALSALPTVPARGSSFAALAAQQHEAMQKAMPASGVLLLRIPADLNFGGQPPRLLSGTPVSPAAWAYSVVQAAPRELAVLLALEDPAGWPEDGPELIRLRPPTPSEARAYLMQKLGVTREAASDLLRETGQNLDRLTLLTGTGSSASQLLTDPGVYTLALALSVLLRPGMPPASYSPDVWQAALGHPLQDLPVHVRSQLIADGARWRPSPALIQAALQLPAAKRQVALEQLAQRGRRGGGWPDDAKAFWFAALTELGDWSGLERFLVRSPADSRFLPDLWPAIRASAPATAREQLARAVVDHYAGRGEYHDSRARDALFSLLESERPGVQVWGRVKLAESSVDAGNFEAARQQLGRPEVQQVLRDTLTDPWTLAARSDALLVQAALARWQGHIQAATAAVNDPHTAQSGARALLWRGLIAKDSGNWSEALRSLAAVSEQSPLLSARARYQEGDLRLRLGQPGEALRALLDAASRLELAGGTHEELARILARAATAERRLGYPARGMRLMDRALGLLPAHSSRGDGVLRARLLSESLPILLAVGQPDQALRQATRALELLRQPGPRRAEAEYRTRRTHYRVALAYLTRGRGLPYLHPFSGAVQDNSDLAYARELLDLLLQQAPEASDREQVLTFDMYLSRALVEPQPRLALDFVRRALDMTDHPYAETQARTILAEAHLRDAQTGVALSEINRAHTLLRRVQVGLGGTYTAEPGLAAQLLALEARATAEDGLKMLEWLRDALQDPLMAPFRGGIWREAGQALEDSRADAVQIVETFTGTQSHWPLRPTDSLIVLGSEAEQEGCTSGSRID